MLKEKTSVHFVNTQGDGSRVMLVPTFILFYWRKILISFVALFVAFGLLLGFFIYQKTSEHYQEELARANFIKRQIDLQQLRKSFRSIDETIDKINLYMKKRGLQATPLENVGMADQFKIRNINDVTEDYDFQLDKALETIADTPIGIPHRGRITSQFGNRNNPFSGTGSERHAGIDFKGNTGEPVSVTAQGKISFAGVKGGYGNCIIVDHGFHLKTLYGHLSRILVRAGQTVVVGQKIGEIGSTGRSTGPHLHYEIHQNGQRIDPENYLKFN